jgi:3-methyladenine DNA glycosylase AlkD
MDVETCLKGIQEELMSQAETNAKESTGKAVPTSQKVYGVRMPVINEMAKEYKAGGFDLVQALWDSGAYEERLLAAKLLGKVAKKDPDRTLKLIDQFSGEISDWAVCDTLGMQSLKPILSVRQKEIFAMAGEYVHSENLWKRRLALVLVEGYTKQDDLREDIESLVRQLANDKEHYVKKAVQWIKSNLKKSR